MSHERRLPPARIPIEGLDAELRERFFQDVEAGRTTGARVILAGGIVTPRWSRIETTKGPVEHIVRMHPDGRITDDVEPNFYDGVVPILRRTNPITNTNEYIFLRERRYLVGADVPSFPQGRVEGAIGQSPITAALNELRQETGYHVDFVAPLDSLYQDMSTMRTQIHFFLAHVAFDYAPQDPQLDEDEDIVAGWRTWQYLQGVKYRTKDMRTRTGIDLIGFFFERNPQQKP